MRTSHLASVALVGLALGLGQARASGFLLYEQQSARALGKGAAEVASADDATAVWFNPAALAFVPGFGVSATGVVAFARTRFTPSAGGDEVSSAARAAALGNLFAHLPLGERVRIGAGLYAPFGLRIQWPEGWVGAEQSLATDLRVLATGASAAVRLTDRIGVAAGASVLFGSVDLAAGLPPGAPGGRADLEGGALGVSANVALLWRLAPERLHVGASYRSRARQVFSGRADFSPAGPGFEETLMDQTVRAAITLPDFFALGVMFRPLPALELSAELDWALWSTFDELYIDFERPATPDRRTRRSPVDPFTGRLGAEWRWPPGHGWRSGWAARSGASLDQSASRSDTLAPSAPDGDRLGLGVGVGYRRGALRADAGYQYTHVFPSTSAGPDALPEGRYRTRAHLLAVTFGFTR
jgi:long-chain fatty acid transport protein